jgi:hypothetical protein
MHAAVKVIKFTLEATAFAVVIAAIGMAWIVFR